jgi:hypothetical protein
VSVARRPLFTATAAATLLCALWFVPSAKATVEHPEVQRERTASATTGTEAEPRLADTGSPDTTPYLIGGTAFLGVGVAFVTYATRRRDSISL